MLSIDLQELGRIYEQLARDGHVRAPSVREALRLAEEWTAAGRPGAGGAPVGAMTDFICARATARAQIT